MKSMFIIIKKELKSLLANKRMIAALVLPGVLMYVLYSMLGSVMSSINSIDTDKVYTIHVYNQHESLEDFYVDQASLFDVTLEMEFITYDEIDKYKEMITNEEASLLITYNDSFNSFLDNDVYTTTPSIEMYYNSENQDSYLLYDFASSVINYKNSNDFYINIGSEQYNLSPIDDATSFIASMVPMLILTLLITSVLSLAAENIAGEKERGTMASLLITPINRFSLAAGKVLSITLPAIVSGIISFVGLIAAFSSIEGLDMGVSMTFGNMMSLLVVILISVVTFAVLISIISAIAKSNKEAQQFASPLLLVVMVVAMLAGYIANPSVGLYFIPIINSSLALEGAITGTITATQTIGVVSSNLLVIGAGLICIGQLFKSERIIFDK